MLVLALNCHFPQMNYYIHPSYMKIAENEWLMHSCRCGERHRLFIRLNVNDLRDAFKILTHRNFLTTFSILFNVSNDLWSSLTAVTNSFWTLTNRTASILVNSTGSDQRVEKKRKVGYTFKIFECVLRKISWMKRHYYNVSSPILDTFFGISMSWRKVLAWYKGERKKGWMNGPWRSINFNGNFFFAL